MNTQKHRATVLVDLDLYNMLVSLGGSPRKISPIINQLLREAVSARQEAGAEAGTQVLVPLDVLSGFAWLVNLSRRL